MQAQADDDAVEMLRQYCYGALVEKTDGISSKTYLSLLERVRVLKQATRPLNGHLGAYDIQQSLIFEVLLKGLTQCVSSIHERKHEQLVKEVLDVQLWRVHQRVREAILDLITHVVVANGALVQSCLQTLVYSLLPPPGPPAPDPNPGERWEPAADEAAVQDEVVGTLEKVLLLVPSAGGRVLPLLLGNVPHKLRDRGTQCLYLRALFALAECRGGAAVREGLLGGVVDHLIGVDVEIRWEDIVEELTEEAQEEEGGLPPADDEEPDIFELEGMSELDLANGVHHGDDPGRGATGGRERGGWEGGGAIRAATPGNKAAGAPEGSKPAVNETADKLDSMMELTLHHLQRRVAAGQLPAAWDTLAAAFERTVLQTHRSKFVQFVLFYACRQAPEACCRSFLLLLVSRLMDAHQPPITRSACAAYIASFLARAAYVPEGLVVECLQRLTDWCVKYARDEERRGGLPPIPSASTLQSVSGDAAARHAAFFSACQAVLYVLCYHMEPLLRHRSTAQHAQQQQPGAAAAAAPVANGALLGGSGGAAAAAGALAQGLGPAAMPPMPTAGGAGLPPLPPGAHGLHNHHPQQAQQAQQQAAFPRSTSPGGSSHHSQHTQPHQAQREAYAAAVHALVASVMPRLVGCPLDPLSSCAKSVVIEFARQARALGFAEVSRTIKEWERRQADPTTCHRPRPLETFFPFDPYLLRRSAALLELRSTYVVWRRGHPAGAVRADLESSDSDDDSDMSDEEKVEGDSNSESSGLSSSSSSSSSEDDSSSEDECDEDELRRTRFGSMPDSFPSSGGSRRGRRPHHQRPHLPGALKASLAHGSLGAGSPTMGFVMPGGGSYSTDGMASPYGTSPYGVYGTSFGVAPMSCTPTQ